MMGQKSIVLNLFVAVAVILVGAIGYNTAWAQGNSYWGTYQGNASHTGYVPVSLNPSTFSLAWKTSFGSSSLNPIAEGDGRVFVSNGLGLEVSLMLRQVKDNGLQPLGVSSPSIHQPMQMVRCISKPVRMLISPLHLTYTPSMPVTAVPYFARYIRLNGRVIWLQHHSLETFTLMEDTMEACTPLTAQLGNKTGSATFLSMTVGHLL